MLKREAQEILGLAGDADLEYVARRTYDICEFLLDLHDRGELRTDFAPVDMTVTYHAPCQQQGHGIGKPALDLMALVPGLRVVENDASCCGVAGHVRAEEGEVRDRDGRRRDAVRADRAGRARPRGLRQRDLPLAHREGDRRRARCTPSRSCTAPTASRLSAAMVGIVIVSHSAKLAEGVVELAREMGGEDVAIEAAGGMADPPGAIGTDAMLVMEAIERGRVAATACSC